jgi:hypothetical protein
MSVFSADEGSCAGIGAPRLHFCQTSTRSLDAYFAGRTRRAVPKVTLRRSKDEICRRLVRKRVAAPFEANVTGGRLAQPRS